jgi:hypothetical protein
MDEREAAAFFADLEASLAPDPTKTEAEHARAAVREVLADIELSRVQSPPSLPALAPAGAEAAFDYSHLLGLGAPARPGVLARIADRGRPVFVAVAAIALSALVGLGIGLLLHAVGSDTGGPAGTKRAADLRLIQARAVTYQAALSATSTNNPCASMAMGAAADALLRAGSCQSAVRARDAAVAQARPAGVSNIRFVPVVDSTHGYAPTAGARATWRSDPSQSVTFIRERGRWVIAN